MKALFLKKTKELAVEDLDLYQELGDNDVRIAIKNVGICGSDIHYYLHGAIGEYVVREPMVLGHEASGIVTEAGKNVTHLNVGDRVCMEPGIPTPNSQETHLGIYNLDPDLTFWATPPIHGCLCESVVHPAQFAYKLPENVSMEEGAMVEPLAIGLHAATKAQIKPGDTALVLGCGTIGIVTALAALASGCSKVVISDMKSSKLKITDSYENIIPVDLNNEDLGSIIDNETNGWGADIVFETTGSEVVFNSIHNYAAPGGCIVLIGIPASGKAEISITGIQAKELRLVSIFRYAHIYNRALNLIASGSINIKPLISKVYPFNKSIEAYEAASNPKAEFIKVQIAF
ncbi:MAG: NAD(P)-dependent alcohol dehydrogenase [Bacteroidetes bacterium]|nr:NAD(P)-dependent alcohol dehydrogenase [Bacteroidota bacterium]